MKVPPWLTQHPGGAEPVDESCQGCGYPPVAHPVNRGQFRCFSLIGRTCGRSYWVLLILECRTDDGPEDNPDNAPAGRSLADLRHVRTPREADAEERGWTTRRARLGTVHSLVRAGTTARAERLTAIRGARWGLPTRQQPVSLQHPAVSIGEMLVLSTSPLQGSARVSGPSSRGTEMA